jgi:outer membrane protein assembly factor BamD
MTKRGALLVGTVLLLCTVWAWECPAPLIWRKGEGWSYERGGVPVGKTPQEQLQIAKGLQAAKNSGDAITAYRRLVRRWPTSIAAEEGYIGLAECLSATDYHYKAFLEYQNLITKYPGSKHIDLALQRQFDIGKLFLNGTKHKVWGLRWFAGYDKAVEVFTQVAKNAPYGKIGPEAQFNIGLAHEKQGEYRPAVKAYEVLLERYSKLPIAETGQFQIGVAYQKEATRAEYDQSSANEAIAAYTDFLVRYPKSDKAPLAEKNRIALRLEQARGLFQIAQFYEKQKKYRSAIIYYSEVIEQNPKSDWAAQAEKKVAALTPLDKSTPKPRK